MAALLAGSAPGGFTSQVQPSPPMQSGGQQTIYMQPPKSTGDGGAAIANANRAGVLSRGRQSTLLTGGSGVSDGINNQRKSLLGE